MPPNIIFLHADQQTYDTLSAYGNKWVKTPNMDRLHLNDISFNRAYCTDPVCAASRTSWMTGRNQTTLGPIGKLGESGDLITVS